MYIQSHLSHMLQSCHHSAMLVARMPATEASDTPPLVRPSVAEVRACHCYHAASVGLVTYRPCKHDTRISDILGKYFNRESAVERPRRRRWSSCASGVVACAMANLGRLTSPPESSACVGAALRVYFPCGL